MALSKHDRDKLPATDFAFPTQRSLPINDAQNVRMAWSNLIRTSGVSATERHEARERIIDRAKALSLDTTEWLRDVAASGAHAIKVPIYVQAMSVRLDMPTGDHVNKMPFKGVLMKLNQPSDSAPLGTGGRRISLSAEAATRSLPSLLGMAVDYKPNFTGHDPQKKIGVITAASIDGDDVNIEGFVYAADFPEVAADIQKKKGALGFSFEAKDTYVSDPDGDVLEIQDLTFTGVAIMLKDRAAYQRTSIAAEADDNEESDMELKDQVAALQTTLEGLVTTVAKLAGVQAASSNLLPTVEPHAQALEAAASGMEKANIGLHDRIGHVAHLRRMASSIRAEAAVGKMPHTYYDGMHAAASDYKPGETKVEPSAFEAALKPITEQIAALGTKIADVAAAAAKGPAIPERKTITPEVTALLARAGIEMPKAGEKLDVGKIDKVLAEANVRGSQAITLKTSLAHAGLID